MTLNPGNDLITPGERVKYGGCWWTVGAVGMTGGERYYWLTRRGEVAMIPSAVVTGTKEKR